MIDGQRVSYQLAERPAPLSKKLQAREIRRLTDLIKMIARAESDLARQIEPF